MSLVPQGDTLYRLNKDNGWYEVYYRPGHTLGFVADFLVTDANEQRQSTAQNNSPFPARPAPKPGYTTCNTQCYNGNCYRTYDDGRQVNFQAQQKWNPFNNQFEWDSGGC